MKTIGLTVVALALMVVTGCGSTVPTTPTGLTVTGTAPITLSWTGDSGATYYYQVTAVGSDGTLSAASNEVTATSQAPFVVAGTKAASQITLDWNTVSGAVSYNVYRSTISAVITNKTRLSTGILTTTYADTSVISGTTYYYQVTALNASGVEFQVSNEAAVTF